MLELSKLQFRSTFGIAAGSAVKDLVLMSVAQEFDQSVMRKMQSISPHDLLKHFGEKAELLLCTKMDGEGTYVYFDASKSGHERLFAFSVGGRVRVGFKALADLGKKLEAYGAQSALLRCELCLQSTDGKSAENNRRDGVSDVIRISFSGSDADLDRLQLVLLDLVMLDRKDLRKQQSEFKLTLDMLRKIAGVDRNQPSFCMPAELIKESDLPGAFEKLIAAGEEGAVVRRLNRIDMVKIKPHRSIDAVVIGYVEGEFEDKYGVNSLLCALTVDGEAAGSLQSFVRVGGGLSDEMRVGLLDQLRKLKVADPMAMTDSSGRVVHFIRPEIMIEIHGEDLIAQENGKPIRSQRLLWDSANGYQFVGLSACPRLSFARFARMREDKRWQDGGARSSQLGVELAATNNASNASVQASAVVIRREVYSKGEMLRKLVIAHQPAASFPYLIYWTDYSAKRAEPLKVSVDIAVDESRADLLAQQLITENIVKGWERVQS